VSETPAPIPELDWDRVRARRLARSFLTDRATRDQLVEVVGALCGVHAQVQTSAGLQLSARVEGLVQADLRAALWEKRTLVKAWTVRGTLHLHPADELPLWLAARRAVLAQSDQALPAWRDPGGVVHPALDTAEAENVRAAVWEALDGRCLPRNELAEEVVKRVGDAPRKRLRSGFAFFLGDLCHGPPQATRITLVRPDQWIDGWADVTDEGEALREVCRRFLRTYGPARPVEFCEWLAAASFRVADARSLFAQLGAELEETSVVGRTGFVLAGDRAFPAPSSQVRLLSEYDVYVMGFRERDQLVPGPVRKLIAAHGRGRYEGPAGVRLVLVDGVAAGVWERRKRGRRVELAVRLGRRLGRSGRAELEREAERVGAFVGLEPVLSIEPSR
jgi:hypothetical protein